MNSIPIVFSTDDNYVMPTAVAIKSILNHTSKQEIMIYILYKTALSNHSHEIIDGVVASATIQANVIYLDVGSIIERAESHISHISSATYYRIALPMLLADYDQCLYLDGDILITDDISELLNIQLSDDEYVAGVSTIITQISRMKNQIIRLDELKIPDFNQYVNAGVLLMNLRVMREKGLMNKMIDMIPNNYSVQDQDIINIVCYGKIKLLSPKYNAMPPIFELSVKALSKVYSVAQIKEARQNPVIIHFANKYKPWKYRDVPNVSPWKKVYSTIFDEKIKYKTKTIKIKRDESILRLKREISARMYFDGGNNGKGKN